MLSINNLKFNPWMNIETDAGFKVLIIRNTQVHPIKRT